MERITWAGCARLRAFSLLSLLAAIVLQSQGAYADDTGWLNPSACSSVDDANDNWSNPNNALTSNASRTSADTGLGITDSLYCRIPVSITAPGVVPAGVRVEIE